MDRAVASILRKWCDEAGVKTPVGYYKNSSEKCWEIYTDRPGFLIGKAGILVQKYKAILNKRFYCEYTVKFHEVRGGFANYIARKE